MVFNNLLLYIASFIAIWTGAGLIISATSTVAKKLRISPFAFSFVILGILTSTPELSVGLQAVVANDPEIFVGNLLGGITVLFLGIIPLLAVFGNGISVKHGLDTKTLLIALGVIIAPALLVLDRRVTNIEALLMIGLYGLLLILVESKHGIFDRKNTRILNFKSYAFKDLIKIFFGIAIVFISSSMIVNQTIYFAELLNISAFYISLLFVSVGTNLPELLLALRSVITRRKDVAMGDYIGSAAANTLLFGVFTLLHNGEVLTGSRFFVTFTFILLGLVLFYFFSRSKNSISRKEGCILLLLYIAFVFFELL